MRRFLDVDTYQVHHVAEGANAPPYAILFHHGWGAKDLSFQDVKLYSNSGDLESFSGRQGFSKFRGACSRAREAGLQRIWVYRLCVDQSSGAERAKIINLLYTWYRDAQWCCVLLDDFERDDEGVVSLEKRLKGCSWFERCWMLQELIAPDSLHFYDGQWNLLGTKETLVSTLAQITRVDEMVLRDSDRLPSCSLGHRMSWASDLQAARPEDEAYSLTGIFGVNLPVLYGEGKKAFLRLQVAILEDTDDLTLFAWKSCDAQEVRGLLAHSAAEFAHFPSCYIPLSFGKKKKRVQKTSAGICIEHVFSTTESDTLLLAVAEYQSWNADASSWLHIALRAWAGQYVRLVPHILLDLDHLPSGSSKTICGFQDIDPAMSDLILGQSTTHRWSAFLVSELPAPSPSRKRGVDGNPAQQDSLSGAEPFRPDPLAVNGRYTFERDGNYGAINVTVSNGQKTLLLGKLVPLATEDIHGSEEKDSPSSKGKPQPEACNSAFSSAYSSADSGSESALPMNRNWRLFTRPPMEAPRLSPQHSWTGFIKELAGTGIAWFTNWLTQSPVLPTTRVSQTPQRSKRVRSGHSGSHVEVNYVADSEDEEVIVVYTREITKTYLACPFYARDPAANQVCLSRTRLWSITDVMRHLWAAHQRPIYCPICYAVFPTLATCDKHIISKTCALQDGPILEGVTRMQFRKLCQELGRGRSGARESQWYQVWDAIFGDAERPRQPYLSRDSELAVCMMRDFWQWDGPNVVENFLRVKGVNVCEMQEEKENVTALQMTILDSMIDELLGLIRDCGNSKATDEGPDRLLILLRKLQGP